MPKKRESEVTKKRSLDEKTVTTVWNYFLRVFRNVRTEKEVRKKLETLKGKISEENSFAFMFACCGRGEDHYRGGHSCPAGSQAEVVGCR